MRLRLLLSLLFVVFFLCLGKNSSIAGEKDSKNKGQFSKHISPFIKAYCLRCHSGDRPRADLKLDIFKNESLAIEHREIWQKVANQIRSGEMPPAGRKQPQEPEKEVVLAWIDGTVNQVDCNLPPDPGRVTIRRLNRAEYNNTIRDLVGVDFHPADDFPPDDVGYGFDNIGDVLTLSPLLVEKYLTAAEKIVAVAFKDEKSRKQILFKELKNNDDLSSAREIVSNFARRAYRRPVKNEEIDRLMRFVKMGKEKEKSLEKGIQLAVKAILVNPHFLFRVELDQEVPKGKKGYLINEFELANRLSYFLWSSMPDEQLFKLAEQKQLRQGNNLEKQVKRMLVDPKSAAFVKNFTGQWLQLRNLREASPDPKRFPSFTKELREAMIRETELFFEAILREDRSIFDFLDADFTFVNERLAKHYQIPGIKGAEFRKVKVNDSQRGGILTQASILTVTSNPTRTSPVNRGKWILENILNAPPPPPPPNVPELEENEKAVNSASLRERLELHRKNPGCASCHSRMDPLGFGLENYSGIGAWREKDGKFPIDASGILPSGEKFSGSKELRLVLKNSKGDQFRRCLAEKMLTYALGRGLEYYDRCVIDDICKTLSENENRFSVLIQEIVKSDPFQKRKGKRGQP